PGALTSIRYDPAGAEILYVPSPDVRPSSRNVPQRSATVARTRGAPLESLTFPETATCGAEGSGRHDSTNETGCFCAAATAAMSHVSVTATDNLMLSSFLPCGNRPTAVGMQQEPDR